jgi:TRAP-type C4-dicarboxylate transport system substrate-binding protein
MNRPAFSSRFVTVSIGIFLAMLAFSASARTLKIATIVPDGSSWLSEMRKAGEEIKEKTQGRVKLKFYPGGVMGGDKTVLRKVRAGQLHGGAFTSGALAAVYPDIELYSLPLLFRDYDEVDFVRSRLDEQLMQGLARNGFEALAITDGGFAYVLSQKPIRKVEDMKGTRVWLVEDDKMTDVALRIAGVAPVPLPIADVYTALQTGLVDTVAAPPIGAIAFQWHTRVNYLTDVPIMYLAGIFAVDQKAFSRISKKDRKVVREVVSAAAKRLDKANRADEINAREALGNQGIEFVSALSRDEVQRWRSISSQAISEMRGSGRYSDEMISEILTLLEEHRSGATGEE